MPKAAYKDVTDKCKELNKNALKKICLEELDEEEFKIFIMRVHNKFYRERVADETGKCKESVSKIFMRAVRKLRKYFKGDN